MLFCVNLHVLYIIKVLCILTSRLHLGSLSDSHHNTRNLLSLWCSRSTAETKLLSHLSWQEYEKNDDECYICKNEGEEEEELVMCDNCPRSFHQKCHLPHIDDDVLG